MNEPIIAAMVRAGTDVRPQKECGMIDEADGCPEYMALHTDWLRLRQEVNSLRAYFRDALDAMKTDGSS